MRENLDRTIARLEHAKRQMPLGYCSEDGCLNPRTRGETCSRHDRTPLKLERDQPGVYVGEYRGQRVRIERRPVYRGWTGRVQNLPISIAADTKKLVVAILPTRIDLMLDHKIAG